ncbi:MAG: CapA family protein [Deltaproteobacteria bacterium]|nr:CapA family protein [Deltaproteobacteria bacterium]
MKKSALLISVCCCLFASGLTVPAAWSETTLIFAGDTHFGENYQEGFAANGEGNVLVDEGYPWTIENFTAFLNGADHVIANLETAVTDLRDPPFPSKAYSHYADVNLTPQNLASNNIRVVSLANNHSLDFAEQGLLDTLAALQAHGIASFGAGLDEAEASEPYIEQLQVGGQSVTVAFIGAYEFRAHYEADYGFYADENSSGAYAIWLTDIESQVAQLKQDHPGVFVVFFPHWGDNYDWKTPFQTRMAHDLIDAGVDMIIGHGAHMLQEVERYRERWIIYSLGNLVFLSKGRFSSTGAPPYGLAMEMVLDEVGSEVAAKFRLYPLFSDNRITGFKPRFVTQSEFDEVRTLLLDRPESATWSSGYTEGQNAAGNHYLEFGFDVLPPAASIAATPSVGIAPLQVSFDGSASSDPGGALVDWHWDLGDGATGSGATVSHAYDDPGVYDVTLTVTGSDGSVDTDRIKIVAALDGGGSSSDILINEVLFDPPSGDDGDANGDGVRSSRGDEFIELVNAGVGTVDLSAWTLSQRDDLTVFTFPDGVSIRPGEYVVVFGGVGSAGFRGFGRDLQLFAANPGDEDAGFAGDGTSNLQLGSDNVVLRDAAGDDAAELVWNSTALTTIATDISGLSGNINESVTRDPDLGASFAQHRSVGIGARYSPGTDNLGHRGTPANRAPIATPAATPTAGIAPLAMNLDGSASSDPDGSLVEWQWDLGDATSDSGSAIAHVYDDPDAYTITLTVTDHEGASAIQSIDTIVVGEDDVESFWPLAGVAQGGFVEFQLDGVTIRVNTVAGQSASRVAENIADSINAEPTLDALGVWALASGSTVYTVGSFSERVIQDPGLHPVRVPNLSAPLLLLLGSLLAGSGTVSLRSRRKERFGAR